MQRVDVLRYGGLSCIIALIVWLIITHVVGKNCKKQAGGINIVAGDENINELIREFVEGLAEDDGKIGRQNAMLVEELKIKLVERVRKLNIGYGPGIFIVPDESEEEADRRKSALSGIMAVPDGTVLEISQIGGKLRLDGYKKMPLFSETTFTPKEMDDVKGAELTGYSFSGMKIESNNRPVGYTSGRTGWTGLSRVYDGLPFVGRLVFDENDVASAGSTITVPASTINYSVNGNPATVARMRTASGVASTSITWAEGGKFQYRLSIAQTDMKSVEALKNIADEISKR